MEDAVGIKVECEVKEVEIENDDGVMVPGVLAECTRCGHFEQSYGVTVKSIRRCLARLRENCSEGESNYYEADTDGE